MRTSIKFLILAAALLVGGAVICLVAVFGMHLDFKSLNGANVVTTEHEIGDDFNNISIHSDTEVITFLKAEDGKCRVVFVEDEKTPHTAAVTSGTLNITEEDAVRFYIGYYNESPSITVYLPKEEYDTLFIDSDTGDVSIPQDFCFAGIDAKLDTGDFDLASSVKGEISLRTDTGKIYLHDLTAKEITLKTDTGHTTAENVVCEETFEAKTSTGRMELSGVKCGDLHSKGGTGPAELRDVIASGEFRIERSTGSVTFDACDAGEIHVETDTGKVSGTLLTDKIFRADSDTGRIRVPSTSTGGICEISTDTGNIDISIP